ncbi:MAG TPA: hypothetical protein DCL31_14475, partial [Clostridium sp.]|nr:hypothetical protein [Clostridium sp.]
MKNNLHKISVKKFLNIVKLEESHANTVKFKVSLGHNITPKVGDSIYDEYHFIMMNEYVKIIKGVAKHIRRKYSIKNKDIEIYKDLKLFLLHDYFRSYRNKEYRSFDDYCILVGALKRALSTLLIKHYKNWVS